MIVPWCNICRQRAQSIERGLVTFLDLLFHVFLDKMHGHMAGPLDHGLDFMLPCDLGQLTQGFEFTELRLIVGIRNGAGPQPIPQAK